MPSNGNSFNQELLQELPEDDVGGGPGELGRRVYLYHHDPAWGFDDHSIRMEYPPVGAAPDHPHFRYHRFIAFNGRDYDPVYGFIGDIRTQVGEVHPDAAATKSDVLPAGAFLTHWPCGSHGCTFPP